MTLPKFIITMDGYFRLGMVNQHKDLLKPGDQCIGGGYYHFDYTSSRIILDRSSYDFGKPKWHLLEVLKVPSVYRGLRLVYYYDDGREFDAWQELQIIHIMACYSRHSIFLHHNDKQKLSFLQSILDKEGTSFVLQEETVYQYDGEPLTVPCISDVNWNDGDGYVWYDFETDMERISEKFNRQYPEDTIIVYVKTEDGFEYLYEFQDGSLSNDTEIVHYQVELQKVCRELNLMASKAPLQLYEVIDIAHHPTILFHYGAYTFIGYNIYEIYSHDNYSFDTTAVIAFPSRNYDSLPYRIKAQQILYDNLLERRKKGTLRR